MTAQSTPGPATRSRWRVRAAALVLLTAGAGVLTALPGGTQTASAAGLVRWADCDELLAHYRDALTRAASPYGPARDVDESAALDTVSTAVSTAVSTGSSARAAAPSAPAAAGDAVGTGVTGTNLQEAGVDEPDRVKLAGDLVVVAAGGRLQVVQGGPSPVLLSSLPLDTGLADAELLVQGTRLLAVVTDWRGPSAGGLHVLSATSDLARPTTLPVPAGAPVVRLVLVDLGEPRSPRVLETLELDGGYVSARLVGGTVRLVTTSVPQVSAAVPAEPYGPQQERDALEANRSAAARATLEQVLPTAVRRGPSGAELSRGPAVDCTSVQRAATAPTGAGTLLVTTLRPAVGLAAVDRTAVTTDGDLVYASASRLYVATSRWGALGPATGSVAEPGPAEVTTQVHAFDIAQPDRTTYVGSGSVPGHVCGRWALSEHDGHLRVATTSRPADGGASSASSVVVLAEQDGRLVERGRLDGLGPDERIYAVRYFGDLATVVTFRETDPLYVLDLGDPARPRLLGELKVPGFSTYLHPVGDDRLLGVGHDADATGRVTGFQVSLFDLTDLSEPAQVARLHLGEGGSPASDDSRAFGYDPQRRLAVLPFTTWDQTGHLASSALAVRVTGDDRLVAVGRHTVDRDDAVDRVVLDGDVTYAVTARGVLALRSGPLARTGAAAFAGA